MDWVSPVRQVFEIALPFLQRLPVLRAIAGFILVFFLPGFAWTFVLVRQVSVLERIALSFGISIAMVTLSLLLLNWLTGTRITGFNAVLVIATLTILPLLVYYLNRLLRRRRQKAA